MVVCGDFRCVVLISRYAIKLPRPKWWRFGRRCNRWEREMWQVWRPRFPQWGGLLCPILFADRFGLIVLMRRACTPIAQHDFMPLDERPFPDTTTEVKSENLGWLDGHVVEIDYALADQNTIDEQRAYYTKHARSSAAR
jgi:hypothetical protein